jgi:hypothetical protein
MPEEEFVSFLKFDSEADTKPYFDILHDAGIEFFIEDESFSADPIVGSARSIVNDFRIKIRPGDFERANALLADIFKEQLSNVDKDYFIFDFTDDELIDVVKKPDEWGRFNFMLAQQLLKNKGKSISADEIEKFEEERLNDLRQTEQSSPWWISLSYIMAILGCVIMFLGVLAIFIGWQLTSLKKTLPNGERFYVYSNSDRKNGSNIFYIALVSTIIGAIVTYLTYITYLSH